MASGNPGKHRRNKWCIDFHSRDHSSVSHSSVASPPGYIDHRDHGHEVAKGEKEADSQLIVKRSWDIALGPLKQVPMNFFIMWMAGSSISIFPIMMVGMMFFRPIQAFINYQPTFKMIEGEQAVIQKAIWLFGNLAAVIIALYKCHTMGLLPLYASDWLAFAESPWRMEWSGGGIMF